MATISGVVKEYGDPVAGRIVRAYRRDTGALLGEAVSGDGSTQVGDPHWANVVSLLPLDTDITDMAGATWSGDAVLSSQRAPRGGGSLLKTNSVGSDSQFISASDGARWAFGSGDYTVELRVLLLSLPSYLWFSPFGNWASNSGVCLFLRLNRELAWHENNATAAVTGANVAVLGDWLDICYSRSSGIGYLLVNGALAASGASTQNITSTTGPRLLRNGTSGDIWHGHVDGLRVTKGVGRHTGPYTPSPKPFPNFAAYTPALGSYSIDTGVYTGEIDVVCLDDAAGTTHNDLIARAMPA